jgi:type I restriction enzyme S subunit
MSFILYKETNFKGTSVGKIPSEWEIKKLVEVINYVKGRKPKKLHDRKAFETLLPYLTAEYMRGLEEPKWCNPLEDQKLVRVEEGDVIMIWDGSYAGHVFTGFNGILASTMIRIVPNREVNGKFLYYFLAKNFQVFRGTTTGTGIPHVNKKVFDDFLVPIPSLKEQQKIAEILSTVDEAFQKTNEVIAKTERLKKGLMQELLTKGIGHKEFKDSEIGRIPKEWKVTKVNKLFDLYKGTTPSTKIKEYWNGTIPFVTPTDITKINDSNEMYIQTTENYITEEGLKSKKLKLVPKGSLLFTSRATIGYLAINKTEVAINQGIISLTSKDANIDITFFYYFLQKLRSLFENLAGGSTYKEISMSTFSNVSVPLPSLSEQQKIAQVLSTIDKKLEIERNEKARLERIKQGLMDLLLTGKIRVKVN